MHQVYYMIFQRAVGRFLDTFYDDVVLLTLEYDDPPCNLGAVERFTCA